MRTRKRKRRRGSRNPPLPPPPPPTPKKKVANVAPKTCKIQRNRPRLSEVPDEMVVTVLDPESSHDSKVVDLTNVTPIEKQEEEGLPDIVKPRKSPRTLEKVKKTLFPQGNVESSSTTQEMRIATLESLVSSMEVDRREDRRRCKDLSKEMLQLTAKTTDLLGRCVVDRELQSTSYGITVQNETELKGSCKELKQMSKDMKGLIQKVNDNTARCLSAQKTISENHSQLMVQQTELLKGEDVV